MSTSKSLQNHLKVLEERHRELDKIITAEFERYEDETLVKQHKLEKLNLKRDIEEVMKMIIIKEKEERGNKQED